MSKKSSRFLDKMLSCFHATTTEATASSSSSQQQQQEEKLVIYVGGVGVDKESMLKYRVPWNYLSYSSFQNMLLEKSGEELKTIRSNGSVIIRCEVKEFEDEYKRVKTNEKERVCKELSYDPRLWAPYFQKEKEKSDEQD